MLPNLYIFNFPNTSLYITTEMSSPGEQKLFLVISNVP